TVSLSPANTSTYNVTGTASATGCFASVTFVLKVEQCAGFAHIENDDLVSFYPNPGRGIFSLTITAGMKISVFSETGQLVYADRLEQGMHTLNLESLNKGLYFM